MQDEALAVIDEALALTNHRDMFSSTEVADLLLDVRTAMVYEPMLV